MDDGAILAGEPISDVSNGQLLAHLDGLAAPEIAQRIEQSEQLRRRAQALSRFQIRLEGRLFRKICPDAQTLGDYYVADLNRVETHRISQHIQRCPHCARELASFQIFLGKPSIQSGLGHQFKVWVAQLLKPPGELGNLQPALALRGETPEPLVFVAEDGVEVALNVQTDASTPGRKTIVGLINEVGDEQIFADLHQEGRYMTTARVDTSGNFTLEGLLPGTYELILRNATFLIHIQRFTI